MTRTGSILGTAHYISPEQAMGEHVGPASDLYSLGVVLYEMLTGELPYDADTPLGIAMKHVNGHLRQPKEVDPQIPAGINAITCRLLAKDPEDRYASDAELIEDLERVAAGLEPASATTEMMTRPMPATSPTRVGPPPPPMGRRNGKRRRTLPLILALLAIPILAALALAGYPLLQNSQEEPPPQVAVPDLVGKTLEEAEKEVGNDFKIEVRDEVESEKPVDTILSQQPQGGKAEKGSTISVNVVGTQVDDVPGVVGKGRDEAEQILKNAGFQVVGQERESSFDEEGRVIGQTPKGGTSVEVNSQVTITVGTGPSTVKVPDLYGNTQDQAAGILDGVGLKLGAVSKDYSSAVLEGGIFFQDPAAGESIEPGSAVNITVSLGPQPVEVPNVFGMDLETAQQTVVDAGLKYTIFEVEDNEPAGTALSTEPQAGTLVDPGSTVTIYYSGGPPESTAPDQGGAGNGGAENRSGPGGGGNGPGGGGKEGKGGDNGGRGKGNNN